ncbi:MAG: hypothetical protein M1366_02220 [Patescibacteria group bacterium]|nr:hypothetical protein [Patescibacteria group bacterium]
MRQKKIAIVIPTIRNLDFLKYWKNHFYNCAGFIIEDHKSKEINTPKKYFQKVYHYTWQDIDNELGKNSWIISRKNAGIRSFGFLKAFQLKADIVITLDDDCYPVTGQNFINEHVENLSLSAPDGWYPTYPHRQYYYTRGIPYAIRGKREVVVSHGLWKNILDFDAPTQLLHQDLSIPDSFPFIEFVPKGYLFPMCSMNLAFKSKITPLMYFPLMGYDPLGNHWGYDRFDDIWAGMFAKKIIDHLGMAVVNGSPFVDHKKASDVFQNLKKEAKGIETNEFLNSQLAHLILKSTALVDCYEELVEKVKFPKDDYFKNLRTAMKIWAKLFR